MLCLLFVLWKFLFSFRETFFLVDIQVISENTDNRVKREHQIHLTLPFVFLGNITYLAIFHRSNQVYIIHLYLFFFLPLSMYVRFFICFSSSVATCSILSLFESLSLSLSLSLSQVIGWRIWKSFKEKKEEKIPYIKHKKFPFDCFTQLYHRLYCWCANITTTWWQKRVENVKI